MFWLNTSIKFLYGYRSYPCCLTLAFNRAIGFSSSRTLDVKMNDPVEKAKRLAAFKAVDNHVVVISFKNVERKKGETLFLCVLRVAAGTRVLRNVSFRLGWCHWNWEWIHRGLCRWTSGTESQGWGFGSYLCPVFFPSQAAHHTVWAEIGRFRNESWSILN